MAKKQKEEQEKEEGNQDGAIPIEWYYPESLVRRYSNNLIVQRLANEFVISFFETIPPPLLGSLEERKKQAEAVKSIRATCVASIIVSPNKMPIIIEALQENFKMFIAQLKREQEEADKEKSA